ncbi:acetyl-CoA synthetase-like protein [Fomes fomentarius]|nr:acetyl-CoA synthetase-like protein [Fomes fomentarius]
MAPQPTPQGVNSPTFHQAPFGHGLSVPGLYQYHAKHSPEHPVFTYSDPADGTTYEITYANVWESIGRVADIVAQRCSSSVEPSAERPVIGILAHADTIAYIYTHVAIMSLGYIAFPLAPRTTPAVIAHLLSSTGANHVIASEDAPVQDLLRDARDILKDKGFQVTSSPMVMPDEYSRATGNEKNHEVVDIADNDITLILHSSGTTAFPKPIRITRRGLVNLSNIPCFGEVDLAGKRIAVHTNPAFHAMGLGTLIWPLTSGATFALYKPANPPVVPTPANFLARWVADKCNIVFCVPAFIEAWARDPINLPQLQSLDCIIFSGASVSKTTGDMLARSGVIMHPFWGSTEVGPATMFIPRDPPPGDEWEYFKMSHHIEFYMQPQKGMDGIFEPIMIPTETCFPHVTNSTLDGVPVFAVGDLLEQHPTDPARWRVFGRKDDQIMLSTGENVNPVPIEAIIAQDPHIASAIMFGRHCIDTGVFIEPAASVDLQGWERKKVEEFKDLIWPAIEKANERASDYARIKRNMILVAHPDTPLEHTPKGTARRGVCLKLYAAEIHALYTAGEGDAYAGNRLFLDRV